MMGLFHIGQRPQFLHPVQSDKPRLVFDQKPEMAVFLLVEASLVDDYRLFPFGQAFVADIWDEFDSG